MSKLSDYLTQHKIDARRVLGSSKSLEALRPEDRAIRLARVVAKDGDEKAKEKVKELAAKKRRSGRVLSAPALQRALVGKPVARKTRSRIVRALNAVLAQKKKGEASATDLF